MTSTSPRLKHSSPCVCMLALFVVCLFHKRSLFCLHARYEALQNALRTVEQELAQTRASLVESKRTFEKNTDYLESQTHRNASVSKPLAWLGSFADFCLVYTGYRGELRVRSSLTWRLLSLSRISIVDYTDLSANNWTTTN
jgi:hypothetical protein